MDTLNIILGSGFSASLGLPGTNELTHLLKTSFRVGSLNPLIMERSSLDHSHAEVLWKMANGYYENPNFETMLHLSETILAHGKIEKWIELSDLAKPSVGAFMDVSPRWRPYIDNEYQIRNFIEGSFYVIAHALVNEADSITHERFLDIKNFIKRLCSQYKLVIGTLNYDDILERVVPVWHDGFISSQGDEFKFNPMNFVARTEFPEILHLHGSVRFYKSGNDMLRAKDGHLEMNLRRMDYDTTQSGEPILKGPMISGLRKLEKLSDEPFSYYNWRLQDSMIHYPRLLVIGYGGADIYLTTLINSMQRIHGEKLRIVFINKRMEGEEIRGKDFIIPMKFFDSLPRDINNLEKYYDNVSNNRGCIENKIGRFFVNGVPLVTEELENICRFFAS